MQQTQKRIEISCLERLAESIEETAPRKDTSHIEESDDEARRGPAIGLLEPGLRDGAIIENWVGIIDVH